MKYLVEISHGAWREISRAEYELSNPKRRMCVESVEPPPADPLEPIRAAFAEDFPQLDCTTMETYGGTKYVHPDVESIWQGYKKCWQGFRQIGFASVDAATIMEVLPAPVIQLVVTSLPGESDAGPDTALYTR